MVCQEAEVNLKGRENLVCHKLQENWIRAKISFAQYEANLKKSRIFPQGQGTNFVMHRNEDLQNLSKAQFLVSHPDWLTVWIWAWILSPARFWFVF